MKKPRGKAGGGRLLFSLFVLFWVLLGGVGYLFLRVTEPEGTDDLKTDLRDTYNTSTSVKYEVIEVKEIGKQVDLKEYQKNGLYSIGRNYQSTNTGTRFPITGRTEEEALMYPNVYEVNVTYKEDGKNIMLNQPALVQYRWEESVDKPVLMFTKLGKSNNKQVSERLVNPTLIMPSSSKPKE
ncbi:hypothetical protein [Bacillus thuringiensis]|uniref:hypothetical protein n=1 Tax=Bacillus thuringiensis TaxID=1428 RepID=UPI000BFC8D60|nr:hypothetical protein [Bacillus thuringiensis]PGT89964.1 hypothetical protein COD17_09450 [Bacillus thuringiensis]